MNYCIRQCRCSAVAPDRSGWGVFVLNTGDLLTEEEAAEKAPEWAKLADTLNRGYPVGAGDDPQVGVVSTSAIRNKQYLADGEWVDVAMRGELEIAIGLGNGNVVTGLPLLAGQQLSPTLARWAHDTYGTEWKETPKPPELTPEEKEKLEKDARKIVAYETLAKALTGRQSVEASDIVRATAAVTSLCWILGIRLPD